jgi:hypothetical protein
MIYRRTGAGIFAIIIKQKGKFALYEINFKVGRN